MVWPYFLDDAMMSYKNRKSSEMSDRPSHPLVIDAKTDLARYATQDDVDCMEAICAAYGAIIRDFTEKLRMAKYFETQLENTYRKKER